MNARGWFTLLVRGSGFVFLLWGAIGMVSQFAYLAEAAWTNAGVTALGATRGLWDQFIPYLPWVMEIGVGVYLLASGGWIVDRFVAITVGKCVRCGYDLSEISEGACPECNLSVDYSKPN